MHISTDGQLVQEDFRIMTPIDQFPDYLVWANKRCLEMVSSVECPEAETILKHILDAEAIWAHRIKGESYVRSEDPPDIKSFSGRIEENAALYASIISICAHDRIISYQNLSGVPFDSKLSDIILQVCFHGAYHRGQIFQCIKQKGGEELDTDYILFTRSQST